MRKKLTRTKLKNKVWRVFSLYVRLKHSKIDPETGKLVNTCVTCGKTYPIRNIQAGHFIYGRKEFLLFDEEQVHPQCYACNVRNHGAWIEYERYMRKRYGVKAVENMKKKYWKYKNKDRKYTYDELQQLYVYYNEKLHGMKNYILYLQESKKS